MSAVIGKPIESICPAVNGHVAPWTRRVVGRNVNAHSARIQLMWSAYSIPRDLRLITLNHFVPLHIRSQMPASTFQAVSDAANAETDVTFRSAPAWEQHFADDADDATSQNLRPDVDFATSFHIVSVASQRGRNLLVSSDGFAYTVKVCSRLTFTKF